MHFSLQTHICAVVENAAKISMDAQAQLEVEGGKKKVSKEIPVRI